MSQTLSGCCVSGHLHEGTPKGTEIKIAGFDTYEAKPEDGSKAKTIVIITDIFGFKLPNVRLLADEYAAQGFYTIVPDIFEGDYVPHELLRSIAPQKSDPEPSLTEKATNTAKVAANLGPWLLKHREAVSKPKLDKVLEAVRADPEVKKVGGLGFCWGARYVCLYSDKEASPRVDAGVGMHPSFLVVPKEIENVARVQINVGDSDPMMSMDDVKKTQEAWSGKTDCQVNVFPEAGHGFAVRGDQNKEEEKKWKDDANNNAIQWFKKHLE